MSDPRDDFGEPPSALDPAARAARAREEMVIAEDASGAASPQDRPTPRQNPPSPLPAAPLPREGIDVGEDASGHIDPPNGGFPPKQPEPLRPTPSPSPGRPPVEPPSPDVALANDASPLPGAHRGGFSRLPTGPIGVTSLTAPAEPGTDTHQTVQWMPPAAPASHRWLAAWALAFAIAGLMVSLFVGWGFPIGLVGVVAAIVALRRPLESRAVAVWALSLGAVSVLYSVGWLLWAASRTNLG